MTEGANTVTTSRFSLNFDDGTANVERLNTLQWAGGPDLANEGGGGSGTCPGPSEYWGQSYATSDFAPPGPVVAGHTGNWVAKGGRTVEISGQTPSACSGAPTPIPIRTRYSFFDSGGAADMIRFERRFSFPAIADPYPAINLRAFVPRLPIGTYGQVVYPNTGGTLTTAGTGQSLSTDWAGTWIALNSGATNAGMVILRDPANTEGARIIFDNDGSSASNNSGISLNKPAGGWQAPISETEYMCFYDATSWPVASRTPNSLPPGCAPRSVPINTQLPAISGPAGNPNPGTNLSATPGTWDHSTGDFDFQWSRCDVSTCTEIGGATSQTYTATNADVGKSLKVTVTATSGDGEEDFAESSLAGSISGTVYRSGTPPTPLSGARVQACRTPSGGCRTATTDANGDYHIAVPQSGNYEIKAFPPASSDALSDTDTVTVVDETEASAPDLVLQVPEPPPPTVNVTGAGFRGTAPGGVPVVHWDVPFSVRVYVSNGPPGTTVEAKLETPNGDLDPIDEDFEDEPDTPDPDDGDWEFDFPSTNPLHGNGFIRITILPPTPEDPDGEIIFPVYIDPSGFVRTTDGAPLPGATVTLMRSDFPAGPFTVVPDGSDVMSPSNRKNPDTSDSTGHFGWDVIAGFYKVRTEKPGCHAPGNPAQSFVETDVMEIPPPVTNLDIRLNCPGPATTDPGTTDPGTGDPGGTEPDPDPIPLLDTTSPETEITKGPKRKEKKGKATFTFTSNERSSTFQCSLDKAAFKPCSSPFAVSVKKGKHTFEVRARDAAGNSDPSPAKTSWTVQKKKKKKRKG